MRRRTRSEVEGSGDLFLFQPALDLLASPAPPDRPGRLGSGHPFRPDQPAWIARAPGRMDVMGGIADYSGSLVLQLPLARSTFAILQPRADGRVHVTSLGEAGMRTFGIALDELLSEDVDAARLGARLRAAGEGWAGYVLGPAQLALRLIAASVSGVQGFDVTIHSEVPQGKGVSSSAALEVAAMYAVCGYLGVDLSGAEVAAACQWVENRVVGAPCGIMDQLASALGRENRLLRIRCQPADVQGYLEIPREYRFYGVDSGVRHEVSGAAYATVRTAAFMGRRILGEVASEREAEIAGRDPRQAGWNDYLANLTPEEYMRLEGSLPEQMKGADFVMRYGDHGDDATELHPDRVYPVRQATRHPVMENARVERFAALLGCLEESPEAAVEMGRLMYESHDSYSACGLGSEETDLLVALVREAGPEAGLFGAKITGGGSGGTVAVLGRRDAATEVRRLVTRYAAQTGKAVDIFADSGPGAELPGVLHCAPINRF